MNTEKDLAILFDVDGTLLDTSEGIINSVKFAENKMDLKPISASKYIEFIGPPPCEKYKELFNLNEELAKEATRYHRQYSEERAVYESNVYEGIEELLITLKDNGYKLGVATLKKQQIAEKILKYHGIDIYFEAICGMDKDERYTKKDTIKNAMSVLGCSRAIMVGDSRYDYEGALEANIGFVGVTYGFGLNKCDDFPFLVIDSPMEFIKLECENLYGKNRLEF